LVKQSKEGRKKMANIMNVVFGIGIAVILFIVVLLGINVFYPGPDWQNYNCTEPKMVEIQVCNPDMTVGDCYSVVAGKQLNETRTQEEAIAKECNDRFQKDNEIYNRNFFYITNIVGVIVITMGLLLFLYLASMINLGVGTSFAGLVLIFVGFVTGWQSTNDKLKFVIGLIIAAIIITYSVIINKVYSKSSKKR
jgi:hypothetical protein